MNILIVDDEYVTRAGLKAALSGTDDFHIVGECANGKQALDMVRKHRDIDVILLDLNMPLMNGIQFLSRLEPRFKGKIIVLSGYDDLDHIKEAMKLGAADYFHKPTMTPEKMVRMLGELKRTMKEEAEYETASGTAEWIKRLIERPSHELLDRVLKWFAFKPKMLVAVLIAPEAVSGGAPVFELKRTLAGWIAERDLHAELLDWGNGRLLLIDFLDTNSTLLAMETLGARCRELQALARSRHGLVVSCGVGRLKPTPLELRDTVREADQALDRLFFHQPGSLLFFDQAMQERNAAARRSGGDKGRLPADGLRQAVERVDRAQADRCLGELFDDWRRRVDRQEIQAAAIELLGEVRLKLKELGMATYAERLEPERVLSLSYLHELEQHAAERIHLAMDWIAEYHNAQYSAQVRQAIRYIREHFAEDIMLGDMAERIQSNPSYLSRIFKQQTGRTIGEYVTGLRMEKATELLMQERFRVGEVALVVGYQNERYFTQVFKQETGLTPTEFRKRDSRDRPEK